MTSFLIVTETKLDTDQLIRVLSESFFDQNAFKISTDNFDKYLESSKTNFNLRLSNDEVKILSGDSKKELINLLTDLYRVYQKESLVFIDQIDSYDISLQHGLLKILEESPKNLNFVLISKTFNNILPTITSRTNLINIQDDPKIKLLDKELLEKVKQKLPKPGEFIKDLINTKIQSQFIAIPDLTKVERDEIDFWLWQVLFNLKTLKKTNDLPIISSLINATILALDCNYKSLQKKFVFENFNVQ